MHRSVLLLGLLGSLTAWATEPPKAPEAPPEVKKTVDALAGKWSATTTMTAPGAKEPVKFSEKIDCKRVAGGRAVSCTELAKVPGMGAMDFAYLVSYDAERKAVHWFAVGNTGEVHDHVCHWSDDKTLECEPLKATMNGAPITETIKMVFDGNKFTVNATTTTKEGDTKVEMVGKRGS